MFLASRRWDVAPFREPRLLRVVVLAVGHHFDRVVRQAELSDNSQLDPSTDRPFVRVGECVRSLGHSGSLQLCFTLQHRH